jgi:hypothetical protein
MRRKERVEAPSSMPGRRERAAQLRICWGRKVTI